jgi:hypothetical protein
VLEIADQRDEINQRVEADKGQRDDRISFGPVIHSGWNGDKHDALGRRRVKFIAAVESSAQPVLYQFEIF